MLVISSNGRRVFAALYTANVFILADLGVKFFLKYMFLKGNVNRCFTFN